MCTAIPRLGSAPLSRSKVGIVGSEDEKEDESKVLMPSSSWLMIVGSWWRTRVRIGMDWVSRAASRMGSSLIGAVGNVVSR